MWRTGSIGALVGVLACGLLTAGATAQDGAAMHDAKQAQDERYVLGYTMNRIEGEAQDLSEYRGKVVLMVNVASRCGLTPQYEQLESLYRQYKDAGLVVVGFPANNFGGQEPGSNADIQQFCSENYDVSFPMFEKISVAGEDKHPLYVQLAGQGEPIGGDPKWNFTKFLVGRDGNIAARFEPRTRPDAPELIARVEQMLGIAKPHKSATKGMWF